MKNRIADAIYNLKEDIADAAPAILAALAVAVIFYFIGFLLRRIFKRKLVNRLKSSIVATFAGEVLFWIMTIIGILLAARILGFTGIAGSILAGAGISAIIFGFAFKDILENFLAGFLLAIQKPFQVGDIIEVENYKGPVKALELRSTRMRLIDGRDIWIPNAMIIKGVLTNYTRDGFLRQEFTFGMDSETDVESVRKVILEHLTDHSEVLKSPPPNVLMDAITGAGINVKVHFWINQFSLALAEDPQVEGETVKSQVMRNIKQLLQSQGHSLISTTVVEHKMRSEEARLRVEMRNPEDN